MKPPALRADARIAIVAASAPPTGSGGVASAHYNLLRALQRRGYSAKLFTFYDNQVAVRPAADIVRNGANKRLIKFISILVQLPFRMLQPGKQADQTVEILRSTIGSLKMNAAMARYAPDVVLLSDHGAPGLWVKKKQGQRFVLVSHHNPHRLAQESALGDFSSLDIAVAVWLENQVLKKVDHVLCPSRYMRRWFKRTYKFTGRVDVAPNLIDGSSIDKIAARDVRTKLGLPRNAPMVYLPSAGSSIKGSAYLLPIIDGILNAVRTPVGFYIPGQIDGDMLPKLRAHPRKQLFFLPGQLPYTRQVGFVKSCDLGISPARMENFSMAILESVFMGVPMLAFKRGGNADIIEDGKNGQLTPAFSVEEIVRHARRYLAQKSGRAAAKRAVRNFTRQKFAPERVLPIYLRAMGLE